MKQETIEAILKIAIENGYTDWFYRIKDTDWYWYYNRAEMEYEKAFSMMCKIQETVSNSVCLELQYGSIIEVITSSEFIDAFSKWLWEKEIRKTTKDEYRAWWLREMWWFKTNFRHQISDAIYKKDLENFFSNLLSN